MPWASLKDVPEHLKKHDGIKLTLSQINEWGELYDKFKKDKGIKNPAGLAWKIWKQRHYKKDGKWVKKGGEMEKIIVLGDIAKKVEVDPEDIERWVTLPDGRKFFILKEEAKEKYRELERQVKEKGEQEKKRGLKTEGRTVVELVDENKKVTVEKLVQVRKDLDAIEGIAEEKKEEWKAMVKEADDLFNEGHSKAYKIGNKIVALDRDIKDMPHYAKILEELKEHLTDTQKQIIGKLEQKHRTLVTTYTLRIKEIEEGGEKMLKRLRKANSLGIEEGVEKILEEIKEIAQEYNSKIDELEKQVLELERKVKKEKGG